MLTSPTEQGTDGLRIRGTAFGATAAVAGAVLVQAGTTELWGFSCSHGADEIYENSCGSLRRVELCNLKCLAL